MFEHRFLLNFSKYKFLLYELVKRDIKIKYRRSALGILWSFLNPLLMMIVLTIVFSTFFQRDIPNYPVYLLTGRLIFDFFSGSTRAAMVSIRSNASIMKKVYVPKYIYSLSVIISNFVNFLISLIVLVLVMIATGASFSVFNLAGILTIIPLFILTLGVGLILATVTVFFRDIEYLYGVFMTLFMYGCAIFYPISIVPSQFLPFFLANPVYSAISSFRDSILYGQLPAIGPFLYLSTFALVSLIIGVIIFYKYQNKFILNV